MSPWLWRELLTAWLWSPGALSLSRSIHFPQVLNTCNKTRQDVEKCYKIFISKLWFQFLFRALGTFSTLYSVAEIIADLFAEIRDLNVQNWQKMAVYLSGPKCSRSALPIMSKKLSVQKSPQQMSSSIRRNDTWRSTFLTHPCTWLTPSSKQKMNGDVMAS